MDKKEEKNIRLRLKDIISMLRIHQWSKNLLVVLALIPSQTFLLVPDIVRAALMSVSLCLVASSLYIINDLFDLKSDRDHPEKKTRAVASGKIPPPLAALLAVVLLGLGLLVGAGRAEIIFLALIYAALSLSYTAFFKRIMLLDVFWLAGLYVFRIYAGCVVIQHNISHWLFAFSAFTFLGLGFLKRAIELSDAEAPLSGRGYLKNDLPAIERFGVGSHFCAAIILALYISSQKVQQIYVSPAFLWLLFPLYLFWGCRCWLLYQRGQIHHDPLVFVIKDPVSWLIGGVAVAACAAALSSGIPGL